MRARAEPCRVLVACEFSGIVRDAFRARGHDAWSCDLLPCERDSRWHIQGDCLDAISYGRPTDGADWDLMIAHPPCTHLSVSGARWFPEKRADGRQQAAIRFVEELWDSPIKRVAIENPVGVLPRLSRLGKATQYIQPWQHGHGETKKTGLWLRGLPKLVPSDVVAPEWAVNPDGTINIDAKGKRDNPTHFLTGRIRILKGAQREQWERIHRCPPGPDRWKERSRTYTGIAEAMAAQWGDYIQEARDES
jgi:hypothetical protein